jgi:hypothetical protein
MSAIVRSEAIDLFYSNRLKADISGWWAALLRRCTRLQSLEEFLCGKTARQRRDAGVQFVPIKCIVASMDRQSDFTPAFLPRAGANAGRWVHLYEALQAAEGFPEVELLRFGDRYAVIDGHHRISVAHAAGLQEIAAHVVELVE